MFLASASYKLEFKLLIWVAHFDTRLKDLPMVLLVMGSIHLQALMKLSSEDKGAVLWFAYGSMVPVIVGSIPLKLVRFTYRYTLAPLDSIFDNSLKD